MTIEVEENSESFKIVIDKNKYLLERPVDIGHAQATMAIVAKKNGETISDISKVDTAAGEQLDFTGIVIKNIVYPKELYTYESVKETASSLEKQMVNGTCKPCVIMKEVEKTNRTYLVPTLRDFLGDCLGCKIDDNPE